MGETRVRETFKNETRFKNIRETFGMIYIFMKIGLIWPNPGRDAVRYILIVLDTIFTVPSLLVLGNDVRRRVNDVDVPNLIRQLIVLVAVIHVRVKMLLSVLQSKQLKQVINIINYDYVQFNYLSEEHQDLVEENIKKTKKFQYIWSIMIGSTLLSFILLAIAFTVYSQLFSDTPKTYMIHECWLIFLNEEDQYSTPYYELFAAYSIYILWSVFVGFVAYDGIFILSILHVSLRLKIISLNLSYLVRDINDLDGIKKRITEFVKGHCKIQRFIAKIENCFQWWLIMLFFNAILQIVMSLSQTTKKNNSDYTIMYYLLFVAIALHTYLLCLLISDVTYNSEEIANVAYKTSWVNIPDISVKKSIAMIIVRAQKPTYFKAMGMLTFNMQLFTKILQTSYSIFTILRK